MLMSSVAFTEDITVNDVPSGGVSMVMVLSGVLWASVMNMASYGSATLAQPAANAADARNMIEFLIFISVVDG